MKYILTSLTSLGISAGSGSTRIKIPLSSTSFKTANTLSLGEVQSFDTSTSSKKIFSWVVSLKLLLRFWVSTCPDLIIFFKALMSLAGCGYDLFSSYALIILSIVSTPSKRRSITLEVTFNLPSLIADKTSSIECARADSSLNPIIPDEPLIECTNLNISVIMVLFILSFSRLIKSSFNLFRYSRTSLMNSSLYSDISVLINNHPSSELSF